MASACTTSSAIALAAQHSELNSCGSSSRSNTSACEPAVARAESPHTLRRNPFRGSSCTQLLLSRFGSRCCHNRGPTQRGLSRIGAFSGALFAGARAQYGSIYVERHEPHVSTWGGACAIEEDHKMRLQGGPLHVGWRCRARAPRLCACNPLRRGRRCACNLSLVMIPLLYHPVFSRSVAALVAVFTRSPSVGSTSAPLRVNTATKAATDLKDCD